MPLKPELKTCLNIGRSRSTPAGRSATRATPTRCTTTTVTAHSPMSPKPPELPTRNCITASRQCSRTSITTDGRICLSQTTRIRTTCTATSTTARLRRSVCSQESPSARTARKCPAWGWRRVTTTTTEHGDIFVTTFANDNYVLFHNDGEGCSPMCPIRPGVGEATVPHLGWGNFLFRLRQRRLAGPVLCQWPRLSGSGFEADGEIPAAVAVVPEPGHGEVPRNDEGGAAAGHPASRREAAPSRDYNNDGDLDVVVSGMDASATAIGETRGGTGATGCESS